MKRCLLVLLLLCLVQTPSYAIQLPSYTEIFKYIEFINVEVEVETSIDTRLLGTKPLYDPELFKAYLESVIMFALKEEMPEGVRFGLGLDLEKEVIKDLTEEGRFDDDGNWDGEGEAPLDRLLNKVPRLGTLLLTVSFEVTSAGQNYAVVALQLYRGASLMLPGGNEKETPIVLDALVSSQQSVLVEGGGKPLYGVIADRVNLMTFLFAYKLQESRPDLKTPSPSK